MKGRGILLVALLAASLVAPAAADSKGERIEALEKKVAELAQQLAELQKNTAPAAKKGERIAKLEQRVAQLERQMRARKPNGDPAREQAAGAEISAIRKLVEEGKVDQVPSRLEAFKKKYAGTRAARATAELAVIGKASPQVWDIDKWFQGENEVDFTSPGPTLLIFWEVWCPHCRREVPKVQRLWESLHPKGLQIVGLTKITKSSTEQKVADFIAQQKLTYPIAKEKGGLSRYFSVRGIPAAAIVKDGKVIWRGHPASLSDKFLESLL